jgi:hypothetical protein
MNDQELYQMNERHDPELPGEKLALIRQTDDTLTLQDMGRPGSWVTSDYWVEL